MLRDKRIHHVLKTSADMLKISGVPGGGYFWSRADPDQNDASPDHDPNMVRRSNRLSDR